MTMPVAKDTTSVAFCCSAELNIASRSRINTLRARAVANRPATYALVARLGRDWNFSQSDPPIVIPQGTMWCGSRPARRGEERRRENVGSELSGRSDPPVVDVEASNDRVRQEAIFQNGKFSLAGKQQRVASRQCLLDDVGRVGSVEEGQRI